MKAVLIYDSSEYSGEQNLEIKEFKNSDEMIKFINEEDIGSGVIAAYEYYKEIKIEAAEKVIEYKIKE